ncbi:hypothetical protein E8L99_17320 [Phreatobacter aquaticus]|uniref:Twin-arginine translocation (Tat) n=1 Tax=Phreatobacter aquaticus TaxID=2570229 RepID=A0A4D7QI38_9HYPH|nr:hypothetical protein [Phreatobacter aquaticus]QCK87390.1 hypothetical protein E8L99_17320 [Phreatobacter aquaticus]
MLQRRSFLALVAGGLAVAVATTQQAEASPAVQSPVPLAVEPAAATSAEGPREMQYWGWRRRRRWGWRRPWRRRFWRRRYYW